MAAMASLLRAARLQDPNAGRAEGEFASADMKQLHDRLLKAGGASVEEALRQGALIEETDIRDLQRARETMPDPTIQGVLDQLIMASGHHLQAFTGNLSARGITYAPQVLDAAAYRAALGGGRGGGHGWRGGRAAANP